MRIAKDLVAASATPLVLALLRQGDSYGYEIIQNMRQLSGGQLDWKEGMLYPLLHRLEQRGFVESYGRPSERGRSRKYYRLLPAGEQQLADDRSTFDTVHGLLRNLTNPKIGDISV